MAIEGVHGDSRRKQREEDVVNGAIVCGVDESASARGAARVARALSRELGLGVVFVSALDRESDVDVDSVSERLERLSTGVNEGDSGAAWSVEVGHPADTLVAVAEKLQAAMIVVGSTGPRSSLLGSVSADVSRRAPCPVVVVPPGADATANGSTNGIEVAGGVARLGVGPGAPELKPG
jgi:nucleotide-binding universal stress UspA family protein